MNMSQTTLYAVYGQGVGHTHLAFNVHVDGDEEIRECLLDKLSTMNYHGRINNWAVKGSTHIPKFIVESRCLAEVAKLEGSLNLRRDSGSCRDAGDGQEVFKISFVPAQIDMDWEASRTEMESIDEPMDCSD